MSALTYPIQDWGNFVATITCAVCNSEKVKKVRKKFSATYNQAPISIPDAEMYECATCGDRFFTPDQAKAVSLAVKRQLNIGKTMAPSTFYRWLFRTDKMGA